MKEKIKNFLKDGRGILVTLFVLEIILTMFITPNKYDDEFFITQVTNVLDESTGEIIEHDIFSFVKDRYFTWTSRVLIEFTLCLVLKISKYMWILIEAFMMTLVGYSISKLFIKENKENSRLMLLFLILIFPFNTMNQAGWAATTVNYIWPLATCLFALIPIRKMWDKEKIAAWEMPLYILALIFAGNQEQTCAILVGFYVLFTIFMILKDKKIKPFMCVLTVLAILSMVFILTCPGNYIRNEEELKYFADFGMLTVLDKIVLGLTAMMQSIITSRNLVYFTFTMVIAVYVCNNYKESLYRVVSLIPVGSVTVFGMFSQIFASIFSGYNSFYAIIIGEKVVLTAGNCNNLYNVLPIIFVFANVICIGLSLLLIFRNLKDNIAFLIFLAGLASKVIIGFSPTLFSSNLRTMVFFDFAMIIITLLIWQEMNKKNDKADKKIQTRTEVVIKTLGVLQYISCVFCVLMTQK